MRNYLTIAGRDSRDFGVYISGQGTFSAPEKAYEFYNVPGRNGAIIGNDHRLENIEVTYQCFIYSNFSQNIGDFRTFLLSLNGYQELTDSYHPDEYRMAVYVGPFEPEVTAKNDAGSFELVFNCKPQRWLYSGDTVYTFVQGSPQSIIGTKVTAYGPKLDTTYFRMRNENPAAASGTPGNPVTNFGFFNYMWVKIDGTTVKQIDITPQGVALGAYANLVTGQGQITIRNDISVPTSGWTWDYTDPTNTTKVFKVAMNSVTEVYACSHFKWFGGITTSAQLVNKMDLQGYACGCFFYQGYLYFADEAGIPETADNTAFNNFISTLKPKIAARGTPTPFTFTPYTPVFPNDWCEITGGTLSDQDHYTFELKYITDSDVMSNPTEFPSSPLIRVNGTGSFTMDGVTVTISSCDSYVDIDCELMDCYEGTTNRNNDVSFSTYDFPKLQPGGNRVEVLSGITVLQITPRWWRV